MAELQGKATRSGFNDEAQEPWSERLLVGRCPTCTSLLATYETQIEFEGLTAEYDKWSDPIRIFPHPPKSFSYSIPKVLRASVNEAQKCLQIGANTAACVMLRRTIEALCHDVLKPLREKEALEAVALGKTPKKYKDHLMLGEGLKELFERKIIDQRLAEWSKQIQQYGNMSAHAVDIIISTQDANDLMSFVTALVEYVYDLTKRYDEFMSRAAKVAAKQA